MRLNSRKIFVSLGLIAVLLYSLLLSGCSVSMSAADALAKDFSAAVSADDFETAASLMHPSADIKAEDISKAVTDIESVFGIDFSDGVEFISTAGVFSRFNFNIFGGGLTKQLNVDYKITISGTELTLSTIVIENSAGIGLTRFYVTGKAGTTQNGEI